MWHLFRHCRTAVQLCFVRDRLHRCQFKFARKRFFAPHFALCSDSTAADADSSSRNVESRPLADQRVSNAHAGQKLTLFLNKAHCVREVFLDPALWYLLTFSCTDSLSLTLERSQEKSANSELNPGTSSQRVDCQQVLKSESFWDGGDNRGRWRVRHRRAEPGKSGNIQSKLKIFSNDSQTFALWFLNI